MNKTLIDELNQHIENFISTEAKRANYQNEKAFQNALKDYLENHNYLVKDEVVLPNMKQYLNEDVAIREYSLSRFKDSFVPDLIIKLEEDNYVVYELKYEEEEQSEEYKYDKQKCCLYVKHFVEVHYAAAINLIKGRSDGSRVWRYFNDIDYNPQTSSLKDSAAKSIKSYWNIN